MEKLAGRVAVVTGAASGLGAAMARILAAQGMAVGVADRDLAGATEVAGGIAEAGGRAAAFAVEVGARESAQELAAATREALGPCALLCANVGVQQMGRLERMDDRDWEWVLGVNVRGTAQCVDAFLPQLRAEGDAHVVVTTSTQAVLPVAHLGVYAASKFALLAYAETLRLELADEGVGVTALLPGAMRTTHLTSSAAARPEALGPSVTAPDDIPTVVRGTLTGPDDLVEPDWAARHLVRALRENWTWWVTHPPHRPAVAERFAQILAAFDRAAEA